MTPYPAAHPSNQILLAFDAGTLDAAADAAVIAHLNNCPPCREKAATLCGDNLRARLRGVVVRGIVPVPIKPVVVEAPFFPLEALPAPKRPRRKLIALGLALPLLAACGFALAFYYYWDVKETKIHDALSAADAVECERLIESGKPAKEYLEKVGAGHFATWRSAAEHGMPEAQWLLARCFLEGVGVEKDAVGAVGWLRMAAANGSAYAENDLGWCHENGEGVRIDLKEAVSWYQRVALRGLPIGMKNLALCCLHGKGTPQDLVKARLLFQELAEQGDTVAQYHLGLMCLNGDGADQPDEPAALRWLRQAAEAGNGEAQNQLGRMCANGWGIEKNSTEAIRWYRLAALGGNAYGQGNLGVALANGEGVDGNAEEAIGWLEKAIAQKVNDAAANRRFRWHLGRALNSRGKASLEIANGEKAEHYFRRASVVDEALVAEAPYHLLFRLSLCDSYTGLGDLQATAKDYEKASGWYTKASDLGSADASRKLADLYANGHGVPKRTARAMSLRRLAVDQTIVRFTIPCTVKGRNSKVEMPIYVRNAFKGDHPLEEEERRLLEDENATLPKDVKDTFSRVYKISRENKVSFVELVKFSLKTTEKDKKPAKVKESSMR